jgi:hypothetical protein
MKTYESIRKLKFNNALSCALDNQTDKIKFVELWRFIADFEHDALWEWLSKRNFNKNLENVVETLIDINILK